MNYQDTIGLIDFALLSGAWLGLLLFTWGEFCWTKRLALGLAVVFIVSLIVQYIAAPPVAFNDYAVCWFNAAHLAAIPVALVATPSHKQERSTP